MKKPVSRLQDEMALYMRPFLCLAMTACSLHFCSAPAAQIAPGIQYASPSASKADAVIFVTPALDGTASVGIVYSKQTSHTVVLQDIQKLLSATGWKLQKPPVITDESPHPDRIAQFPVSTGIQFALKDAAQVQDSLPAAGAYLTGLQRLDHIEVNFAFPDMQGADNLRVDSPALTVELNRNSGLYQFEADVRDHKHALPRLDFRQPVTETPPAAVVQKPAAPQHKPTLWSVLLIALGAGILGFVGIYTYFSRRV